MKPQDAPVSEAYETLKGHIRDASHEFVLAFADWAGIPDSGSAVDEFFRTECR